MIENLDLFLRGIAGGQLLLIAILLWRDHRKVLAARLGALLALSGAAHGVVLGSGLCDAIGVWKAPVLGLALGGNVVFWLFTRALFEDGFKPRWHHALIWSIVVVLGLFHNLVLVPDHSNWRAVGFGLITLETLAFAGLALFQVLSVWQNDLVEVRRRLRLYVVGGAGAYILLWAISDFAIKASGQGAAVNLAGVLGLTLLASMVCLSLMRIDARQIFQQGSQADVQPVPGDLPLAEALLAAMTQDRLYRQDRLTIGALAKTLSVQEHRLRRLINQRLGHRNFSSYVNGFRLDDARRSLADPDQAQVPVLTIALDAGFGSLGPFNRAFKADTGFTPTEYRRMHLAESGIGQSFSESAER
jgi:AraC-like DNA-binding protein